MKEKKNIFFLSLIFVCVLCACSSKTASKPDNMEENLQTEKHLEDTDIVPDINVNHCFSEYLELEFATSLQSDTERVEKIQQKIREDLSIMDNFDCEFKKYKIQIQEKILKNKLTYDHHMLTCTEEQIYSGEYLEPLVCNMMKVNIKDIWKKYAYFNFCYENEINKDEVCDFLKSEENQEILSMFPAYFLTEYCSAGEIDNAKRIAGLYGKYVIDTYGQTAFWNCKPGEYINEWLKSMNLNIEYIDPYAGLLDEYTYEESDYHALVVLKNQNMKVFCNPPEWEGKDVKMLRSFLYESSMAVEKIMEIIKRDAPDYYERVNQNIMTEPIRVYFDLPLGAVEGYADNHEIHLSNYSAFSHEIGHLMIPCAGKEEIWKYEGLNTYFQYCIYTMSSASYRAVEVQNKYLDKTREDFESERGRMNYDTFFLLSQRYGRMTKDEDARLLEQESITAQLQLLSQRENIHVNTFTDDYQLIGGANVNISLGNELTYDQALFFVKYLIENHSLNAFLKYCMEEVSFEEAFGNTYENEKENWIKDFIEPDIEAYFYEKCLWRDEG